MTKASGIQQELSGKGPQGLRLVACQSMPDTSFYADHTVIHPLAYLHLHLHPEAHQTPFFRVRVRVYC